MRDRRKMLGLAVTEQGITAVELGTSGGRQTVLHAARLTFSNESGSLEEPEKLGRELRQVLRRNGFSASRCVMGLAASWIAAREKVLPAADAGSLRGILAIAAEREFASDPQDLLFDYAQAQSGNGVSALLVAAPRRITERLLALAKAAGLSVTAITSSGLALATAMKGAVPPAGRVVLCLLPRGVELIAQSINGLRWIRHLPVCWDDPDSSTPIPMCVGIGVSAVKDGGTGSTTQGTGETPVLQKVRRVLALAPADQAPEEDSKRDSSTPTYVGVSAVPQAATGGTPVLPQARELLVWDLVGLDSALLGSLGEGLGSPVRLCKLESDLGIADVGSTPTYVGVSAVPHGATGGTPVLPPESGKSAQAAALVCCPARSLPIDFLHSRLAPLRSARLGRWAVWAIVATVVLLAAGLGVFLDWRANQRELAALQQQLDDLKITTREAKSLVDDVALAQAWYDHRPRLLDGLREITQAFPEEGRIWATSVVLREDMQGSPNARAPKADTPALGTPYPVGGPQLLLSGKSVSESAALEVLDRLKANPRLTQIKPLYIRRSGGASREVSFAVSLRGPPAAIKGGGDPNLRGAN